MKKSFYTLLAVLLFPSIALAHPGHDIANFAGGFSHPFTGIDHLLVMLAVGYWAGKSQTAAKWQVPVQFTLFMLVGIVLGAVLTGMAFVELAIAVSVLAMGLVILLNTQANTISQLILATVFAVLHGFVHGQEMIATGGGFAAVGGIILATMLLLGAGVYLATFKNTIGLYLQRGLATLLTLSGTYLLFT